MCQVNSDLQKNKHFIGLLKKSKFNSPLHLIYQPGTVRIGGSLWLLCAPTFNFSQSEEDE